LEVCFNELEKLAQIPIDRTDPVVTYQETVTTASSQVCLSKSQNKHNRLYATAEPLGEDFCKAMDDKTVQAKDEPKELSRVLVEKYGWES
jgi:elongation factor 2